MKQNAESQSSREVHASKAIQVSYRPVTSKPACWTARDADYNTVKTSDGPDEAAIALCAKMNWFGTLIKGWLKPGVWVYVWKDDDSEFTPF